MTSVLGCWNEVELGVGMVHQGTVIGGCTVVKVVTTSGRGVGVERVVQVSGQVGWW